MELLNYQFLRKQGYYLLSQFIVSDQISYYKNLLDRNLDIHLSPHGIRNVQEKIPDILNLAYSKPILMILKGFFQQDFKLVRAIYFDKTKEANWGVPWHQDKTIAVDKKIDLPGFKAWSVKGSVIHVQPPLAILKSMITVRIHLDQANKQTGTLQIIPKSHRLGILNQSKIAEITKTCQAVSCQANSGDVLIMSPLILHRSLKALNPTHRRVVHLEYSCAKLPSKLNYYYNLKPS